MNKSEQLAREGAEDFSKKEWRQKARDAYEIITGRRAGEFNEIIYLSSEFRDSQGRWVDFRLHELEKGKFLLYENCGDPLALLELKQKFEERGLPISRLNVQASERTPEVEKILGLAKSAD